MKDVSHIFHAIDVRGVYKQDLDETVMKKIGNVFATFIDSDTIVARDMRISSPSLHNAFCEGVMESGRNVIDIGLIPIGTAGYWSWKTKTPFAYITASHATKEWNGVKMFHNNGMIFEESENRQIKQNFIDNKVSSGSGRLTSLDTDQIMREYIDYYKKIIKIDKKIKVVLDCGNGMGSMVAPFFQEFGVETDIVFGTLDGTFPNRSAEPLKDDLKELRKRTKNADIGIAFDGDSDRFAVVDNKGRKLSTEQASYVILSELFKKEKGGAVANVECSNIIDDIAKKFNRPVHRVKVGHTFMFKGARDHNACYGVEKSGHAVIPSLAEFYDTVSVVFYLLEAISKKKEKLSDFVDKIPNRPFDRVGFKVNIKKRFEIQDRIKEKFSKQYEKTNTLDGIRIDLDKGWVLIRASNTEPLIRLTVEADSDKELERLKKEFSEIIEKEI